VIFQFFIVVFISA